MVTMPAQNKEFELPPAGTHLATCYRVIDLGTQLVEYKGTQKKQHKIMLSWELPDELMEGGEPFTIHQRYTLSSSDKATLRQHLEAWRGVPFTDEDFGKFDIGVLIGKSCLLGIVHNTVNGKTYANIGSISRLMKGQETKPLVNEPLHFDLAHFDQSRYDELSDGLKAIIAKSPEYGQIKGAHQYESVADAGNGFKPDSEIPF